MQPRVSITLCCVVLGIVVNSVLAATVIAADHHSDQIQTRNTTIHYDIPAGSLIDALSRFARQSGVAISVKADQLKGLQTPGLTGSYSIEAGFAMLLAGSGYQIRKTDAGYVLQQAPIVTGQTLPMMTISTAADSLKQGTAEEGYRVSNISGVGPWGQRSLQDTPYSMNVVSEELIKNLQAYGSPDEVFKINPVTQFSWPSAQADQAKIHMRGFETDTVARNGLSRQGYNYAHGIIMEEVNRIEVLTGLSGFLYGAGNVGGIVNYVTKRPTQQRFNSITLGNTTGQNLYAHGDFGGRFGTNNTFGYRINAAVQDGETQIKHTDLERWSVSGLFDWQIADNLLIEFDLSKRDYRFNGRSATWSLANGVSRPDANDIDADISWGQKWSYNDMQTERFGVNLYWDISDHLRFRTSYLNEENIRSWSAANNEIQADGTYNQSIYYLPKSGKETINGENYSAFLDLFFNTYSIEHNLVLGYQLSKSYWDIAGYGMDTSFNGFSLDKPTYIAEPEWDPYPGNYEKAYKQQTTNITVGDNIKFNEQWSLLIGGSHSRIIYKDSDYDKSDITPTLSVMYKPWSYITTYATYMESFQQGGVAGRTFGSYRVTNANEVMKPLESTQIEVGAKIDIGGMLLTAAVYEIDKGLEYYNIINNTEARYVQDGRQVHRGVEFTATGKLTDNLALVGGASWLDPKIKENKQRPEIEGNRPSGVATQMYKAYLEYSTPFLPGLALNGGVSYTGNRYGDEANTDKLGDYILMNIGARYSSQLFKKRVTYRFNVNNITGEQYWANRSYLGEPRTFIFSVNAEL